MGKQDNFEFDFNQLLQAKGAGFVSAEEGRAILKSVGWKLDDGIFAAQQVSQPKQKEGYFPDTSQPLYEINDCHDPGNGQFCSGSGGEGSNRIGSSKRKAATSVKYSVAEKRYYEFASTTKSREYSFDPRMNKGYDIKRKTDAIAFHKGYSDGSDEPVVIMSVTNNKSSNLNKKTERAYNKLVEANETPLIGRWKSKKTTKEYTDISYPLAGLSDMEIKKLLSKHRQEAAILVTKEGRRRTIYAE